MLTTKMKAKAIEPPIDAAKIPMTMCLGTSTLASGLSGASPPGSLSVSLSSSRAGRAKRRPPLEPDLDQAWKTAAAIAPF